MIAYVPLRTEKYHTNDLVAINGIFGAVGAQLLITLAAIESSYRAGIELGIGTEFEGGGVYGPALAEAYKLENEVAKYPRIVIGKKLKKYLDEYSKGNLLAPDQIPRDVKGSKIMADVCLRMIDKALDGCLILDYLGKEFRNIFLNKIYPSGNVYNMAIKVVKEKLKEKSDSGDMEVAAKYEKLLGYFELKLSKS